MLPPKQPMPATYQRAKPQTRLDLDRIRLAIPKISPVFRNTPQYACPALGEALDCELIVKLETANPVRCFKGRGTETVMARLSDDPRTKSAVCASAGNLGLALAYSGLSRGISVTVVAGASANPYKLERIQALGAKVRIVDGDFDDARHLARRMADIEGAFLVEDSENLDTCEGAGTIGLELIEDERPRRCGARCSRGRRHGDGRRLCLQMPGPNGRDRLRATKGRASDGVVVEGEMCRRDRPHRHDRGWSCWPPPNSGSP